MKKRLIIELRSNLDFLGNRAESIFAELFTSLTVNEDEARFPQVIVHFEDLIAASGKMSAEKLKNSKST